MESHGKALPDLGTLRGAHDGFSLLLVAKLVEPALQRLLDLPACNGKAHTACQPAANTRLSGMWSAVGDVVPRTGDTDTDRGLSPPPPSTAQANPTHTRPLRTPTHQPHCACAPCAIAASAVCCASPVAAAFERSAAWCTSSFSVTIAWKIACACTRRRSSRAPQAKHTAGGSMHTDASGAWRQSVEGHAARRAAASMERSARGAT